MNMNELIKPDPNQRAVRDHSLALETVSKAKIKPHIDERNVRPSNDAAPSGSVKVDISPIWEEVASEINLRRATADEVAELSSKLFKADVITFEDHVNLSFQENPDEGEIDFIHYWQNRQQDATYHGASRDELSDIIRIQSILGYVDSLRN